MPITEQSLSQGYPAYTFRVKLVFDQLAFIGSRSVWNDGCDPRLMGFDILPFECRGVVLWVPQTTDRTSCAYELNLTPDSRVASLLAPYSIHFDGRRITAWCHLYRTVLYHVQYMIPMGLLWHRIPVPCFHCPRLDEFWNHDSDALSPSMHRTTAGHGALSLRPRLPAFMCSVTLSCTTLQSWIWTVLRALYSTLAIQGWHPFYFLFSTGELTGCIKISTDVFLVVDWLNKVLSDTLLAWYSCSIFSEASSLIEQWR